MTENPLKKLESFGQSIWIDFIRRGFTRSGDLEKLITEDGISGETSNPSIFEKAIVESHDYDDVVRSQTSEGMSADDMFLAFEIKDIQEACDLLRPIFDKTHGADGFVSIEVSPGKAHDTQGSIDEAHMLWQKVNRPNLMVKVPGTKEGLPAIRQLTSEGMNINITLLFGLPRYREVTEAYISGLEERVKKGQPIDKIASVASFFLSRIDVLLDPQLEKIMQSGGDRAEIAKRIHGRVAIASAKIAYQMYLEIFENDRFKALVQKGAHPQRLLWASTSTKNPDYPDVYYVEALIGPNTVNTLPLETIEAYRDHGNPAPRLEQNVDQAYRTLADLQKLGISIDQTTQQLEDEGVEKFANAYGKLMDALNKNRVSTPR